MTLPVDPQSCAPSSSSSSSPPPHSLDTLDSSVKIQPLFSPTGDAPPLTGNQRFVHSGWAWLRNRVRRALFHTSQTVSRVTAFDECCTTVSVFQNADDPAQFAIRCNRCHDRLCMPCAAKKSLQVREALMSQIEGKPHTFITLTLSGKNEELTELIDRLYKHFRALRLHPTWADNVRGGAAFLEIKWSEKAKRWHPHLHIVADADFIPQADLSDAWRSITRDSWIVDIRRISDQGKVAAYVTKYASKPLNMTFARDPNLLQQAVMAIKGRRLCLCFGTWYGTPLTYVEDADLDEDNWMKDPYRQISVGTAHEIWTRWQAGNVHAAVVLRLLGLQISTDVTAPSG